MNNEQYGGCHLESVIRFEKAKNLMLNMEYLVSSK